VTPGQVYVVPRLVYTPAILSAVALLVAGTRSWWALAAIPFIGLGCLCAAPNLNLANGCLAYVSMIVGLLLGGIHGPLSFSIFAGTAAGLYGGALEQNLRMRVEPDRA
jgi:hypothetical protein